MMKSLSELLNGQELIEVVGDFNPIISSLAFDSREVGNDILFFAIRGTQTDGHSFIEQAIAKGAAAIICEDFPETFQPTVCYIKVACSSYTMGKVASIFYDFPSSKLKLIGITGTNGKTTTVTVLYKLVNQLGGKSGLISTIACFIGDERIPSTHTTPDTLSLNRLLKRMVDEGCTHCFMEVSSHSVVQNRIAGLMFAGGIFSNITHDHLDYHKTFAEYIKAKKMFFDGLSSSAFALTNVDDRNGRVMIQNTKAKVYTYSLRSMADFRCKIIEHQFDGMLLSVDGIEFWSRLIGGFNAYNLLAVYSAARLIGYEKDEILRILSLIEPVSGRFEHVKSPNGVIAVVDYAHTPDALENVISTISKILPSDNKLITVIGAGGNRDKTKRPVMAQVAVQGSNLVILTSDNPRNEDPNEIINDMKQGVSAAEIGKVLTITDRRDAIRAACLLASAGDFVLVAGKGHENYQEFNGEKVHFDDKEEIEKIFNTLKS